MIRRYVATVADQHPRRYSQGIVGRAQNQSPKRKVGSRLSTRAAAELPPFERVQRLVQCIPRGKVVTYGQLSRWIDGRLTSVGVGWAIRAADASEIPWQRVVNGQGGISTDKQHPGLQRAMLEAEGVKFGRDGRIDLARFGWQGPGPKPRSKP